jgi:hypothetical protein
LSQKSISPQPRRGGFSPPKRARKAVAFSCHSQPISRRAGSLADRSYLLSFTSATRRMNHICGTSAYNVDHDSRMSEATRSLGLAISITSTEPRNMAGMCLRRRGMLPEVIFSPAYGEFDQDPDRSPGLGVFRLISGEGQMEMPGHPTVHIRIAVTPSHHSHTTVTVENQGMKGDRIDWLWPSGKQSVILNHVIIARSKGIEFRAQQISKWKQWCRSSG